LKVESKSGYKDSKGLYGFRLKEPGGAGWDFRRARPSIG
jgi:hypothetical protein